MAIGEAAGTVRHADWTWIGASRIAREGPPMQGSSENELHTTPVRRVFGRNDEIGGLSPWRQSGDRASLVGSPTRSIPLRSSG